jgi:hypothetical protein
MDTRSEVINLAAKAGVDRPLLHLYYDILGNDIELDVDERIASYTLAEEDRKGRVLFPLVEGGKHAWSYISSILGHAFRTRGYEPVFLLCDGCLSFCPRRAQQDDDPSTCRKCHYRGDRILSRFGHDHLTVSGLLPDDYQPPAIESVETARNRVHNGVEISEFALASTRQILKRYHVDFDDPEEGETYRRLVQNAAVLVDAMNELLDTREIDYVIGSRPVYMYEGMLLEVANQREIPARTYASSGYRSEKINFGDMTNRHTNQIYTDYDYVQGVLEEPLTEAEATEIDRVMEGRQDGSEARVHYTKGANQSIETTEGETTLGMFTNVLWDAALEIERIVFDDIFDWVTKTIDYVGGDEEIRLVVKPHPGEVGRTNESMYDWIQENLGPLPSNVDLLRPDTDVDTYELIEDLDGGLVYNSTVGLEMAYYGYPVVVAGMTHYRDLRFTFDPTTFDEYTSFIDSADELTVTDEMRDRARRYAHLVFVRKQLDFPFHSVTGYGLGELRPVSHDDLTPGNPTFDTIVESIIAGEPVVQ